MIPVCHIVSGDLWAGAETMVFQLFAKLAKRPEVNLSVVLLNEGRLAKELVTLGVVVTVLDERMLSFPRIVSRLRNLFSSSPPSIVHSHRYKENFLAYLAARDRSGIRLMATQHGMPEVGGKGMGLKYRLAMRLNFTILRRNFYRVFAVSRDIRNAFVDTLGFPEDMVRVVHNGITVPGTAALRTEREGFIVGSSGRLTAVKDYTLMVDIAKEITREAPDVRFEIAGEGPAEPEIARRIRSMGLEGVFRILGFVEDVDSFYAGLDLYMNTSRHEGIPMSILEAMSLGIPVVAPDVGGIGEIVEDGVTGFLVRGRDPADFAERCIRLRNDSVLRSRFSAAARERVRHHFSAGRMAEEYMNVYLAAEESLLQT